MPYMGGITFLDYVKELPKGKREAKGATRGGYATSTKKPAAAKPVAAETAANGDGATPRGLPEASQATAGGAGGGGSEADLIGAKIDAKVKLFIFREHCCFCFVFVFVFFVGDSCLAPRFCFGREIVSSSTRVALTFAGGCWRRGRGGGGVGGSETDLMDKEIDAKASRFVAFHCFYCKSQQK